MKRSDWFVVFSVGGLLGYCGYWINREEQETRPRVDSSRKDERNSARSEERAAKSFSVLTEKLNRVIAGKPEAGVESGNQPKAILREQTLLVEHQVVESLSGNVDPNGWMDTIAEFVQFPLSPVPVADWRDESVDCYEFLIGDPDVKAYFEIDREDQAKVALRIESQNSTYTRGLHRRSQSLVFYLQREAGDLYSSVALQAYSKIALGKNRSAGIEAYRGTFREGCIYQYDPESRRSSCFLQGIKDGFPAKIEGECQGDLNLDLERVRLLNDRVTMILGEIGK